jgi:hypothetical protein
MPHASAAISDRAHNDFGCITMIANWGSLKQASASAKSNSRQRPVRVLSLYRLYEKQCCSISNLYAVANTFTVRIARSVPQRNQTPAAGRPAPPMRFAAASPVEMIKRVCKFSLAIVLFMVVAGIIALKIAMWMRRFNV